MRIAREQIAAFERLSHDHNPLHTDAGYARSTQFGRPVAYGMCSVVLGLAAWAGGRCFRLSSLKGQFSKPLFESEDYELKISENGNQVKVQYLKCAALRCIFAFHWEDFQSANQGAAGVIGQTAFQPRLTAQDSDLRAALDQWQSRSLPYFVNSDCVAGSLQEFGLCAGQMPLNQLNALLGSSYLVGMELPGRQALYSRFEFEFDSAAAGEGSDGFEFSAINAKHDERLNRIAIAGRGTGIRSFSLVAFKQPRPVRHDAAEIRAAVGQSDALANKTVFISGATRGFGAVLARTMALQGAGVMVNYRTHREEAEALAGEIRDWNPGVSLHAGDVSVPADCRRMATEIRNAEGRIDILISNAFPQISAQGFLEQDTAEFLRFVEKSVSATVSLFREMIPLMPKGGIVVLVSTVFTEAPKPQFSHYVAAKSALEGLMRALALEFRDLRFLIVRPPRMLTDQTNLALDLSPPLPAVEVGRRFLNALLNFRSPGNLSEINLSTDPQAAELKAA
jgi:NAD(P)-dependent dehydrogenase (short-subunit alcohol dehydrogenase family)